MELESVQLGAADVDEAAAAYALLLGLEPIRLDGATRRFELARGAVEIVAGTTGPRSVRFVGGDTAAWTERSFHGLTVLTGPARTALPPADGIAIDHIVVRTPAADRAIRLWRDELGLRLALDRAFPERGLRLVFFRSGGITLEFASPHPPPETEGTDRLYGISYRVPDLATLRQRLVGAGLDVSPIRAGFRPGTSVASVRSGTAGVPTLLLQVNPAP